MIPTLTTPNLVMRRLTKATERQVRWLNTPEVVKHSENRHVSHSLKTQEIYLTCFAGPIWGIYDVVKDEHIGNISARVDKNNNIADVGILIGECDYWKKGLGKEAWETVCNWLIDREGGRFRKIEAGCMANNVAMLRILAHTNFVYEGERLNHFLFNGSPVGMKLFGRFR